LPLNYTITEVEWEAGEEGFEKRKNFSTNTKQLTFDSTGIPSAPGLPTKSCRL